LTASSEPRGISSTLTVGPFCVLSAFIVWGRAEVDMVGVSSVVLRCSAKW
jgi:hypothetical protein